MQLFVNNPFGTIFTIESSPQVTVDALKRRILAITSSSGFHAEDMRLTFAGNDLVDQATLVSSSVTSESMLSLGFRLRGGMQPQSCPLPAFDGSGDDITPRRVVETRAMINMTHPGQIMISIQMISDQKLNIFAPPSSTVLSIKHNIAETIKVATDNQRLLFSGKVLQDDSTLEDYGLETGSIIQLSTPPGIKIAMQKQTQARVRGPEPEVQIFVKNLNGKTMALMISPTDTVESLMKKVQERTDIPPSEQRILYGGKQLVPEKILADYNISRESTLHLVLRLRGGSWDERWI